MVEDYGFDGVDIDYEAARADQTADFVALFKELREALDKYAKDKGDSEPYLITSAVFTKAEEWTAKATEYIGEWEPSFMYPSNDDLRIRNFSICRPLPVDGLRLQRLLGQLDRLPVQPSHGRQQRRSLCRVWHQELPRAHPGRAHCHGYIFPLHPRSFIF